RIQGWCDSPLTELGIQQAQNTAAELKKRGYTFDTAYSSVSERAWRTLEEVYDGPYTLERGLKEMNFGELEGDPEEWYPDFAAREQLQIERGGESYEQVADRMEKLVRDIVKRDGNSILIAGHGVGIWAVVSRLMNRIAPFPGNAAFYVLEYDTETEAFELKDMFNVHEPGEE
ncbi:MAG: histidine phosphatase family protein, partial [Erysipelotrichaceae bacterium]|nr:histidine phosphatase family protein [Erysipelotrichaceae bacterium]